MPDDAGTPHDLFAACLIQLIGSTASQSLCDSGHRLGAVIASRGVLGELGKVLDTLQICRHARQIALAEEMEGLSLWIAANRQMINARARAFRRRVAAVPNFRIERIGAYFAYVRHGFAGRGSEEVAKALAMRHGVLALPGSWFGPGQEQHLRFAFANADAETLRIAAGRMARMTLD